MGKQNGLTGIEERNLAAQMSSSGFAANDIQTALSAIREKPSMLADVMRRISSQPNPYADTSTASDRQGISWAEEFGAGVTNSAVSFGAGMRQLFAMNDMDELRSIRKWQDDNEVKLTNATKRAIQSPDFNPTQFWFNTGSAIGSTVPSYGAAAAAAFTGVGIPAAIAITAMASYPQVYNSLLNSALDAGYSADDAVKYAHLTALPISAIEILPAAKFGRILGGKAIAGVAREASEKFLPQFARRETAERLATDIVQNIGTTAEKTLDKNMMAAVYKSTKNGIIDRLLVSGGKVLEQGAAEGAEEMAQNYLQKYSEFAYDESTGKNKFGTTMADVTSKKQVFDALKDGFYGAIAGGGMALTTVTKPIYEQGVYNTLALYDQRGTLDTGFQKIAQKIVEKSTNGTITPAQAESATTVLNDVYATYKKLGGEVKDPEVRYSLFRGIQSKNAFATEITQLEAQKADLETKIQSGELDETLAATGIARIDNMIARRNEQYAFTSQWLKGTADEYFQNRTNAARAKVANLDNNLDEFAQSAQQEQQGIGFWDKLTGNTPDFAATKSIDLNKGLQLIDQKYNDELGLVEYNQVKDSQVDTDFDVFEEAEKTIRNEDGTFTKARFAHDGNGNYARQVNGDSGTVGYVKIPATPFYEQRLSEIFGANTQFDAIAEKLIENKPLTDEERVVYDNFKPDIESLYQQKKSTDNGAIDLLVRDNLGLLNAQQTDAIYNQEERFTPRQRLEADAVISSVQLYEKDYQKIVGNSKLDDTQKAALQAGLLKTYPELAPYISTINEQLDDKTTESADKRQQAAVRKETNNRVQVKKEDVERIQQDINVTPEDVRPESNQSSDQSEIPTTDVSPAPAGVDDTELAKVIVQSTTNAKRRTAKQKVAASKEDTTTASFMDTLGQTTGVVEQIYQQIDELPQQQPSNEDSNAESGATAEAISGSQASFDAKKIDESDIDALLAEMQRLEDLQFDKNNNRLPNADTIQGEINRLEKIAERLEWDSIFSVPLKAIDGVLTKILQRASKFIETWDAIKTRALAKDYLSNKAQLSDVQIKAEFIQALLAHPDKIYSAGLQLRESFKLALQRGISIEEIRQDFRDIFARDGYDAATADGIMAMYLERVFKGAQVVDNPSIAALIPENTNTSVVNAKVVRDLIENEVVFEKVKELIPSLDYVVSRSQMMEEIINSEENMAVIAANIDTLIELDKPKKQLQLRVQRKERGEGDFRRGHLPLNTVNTATRMDGVPVEVVITAIDSSNISFTESVAGVEEDEARATESFTMPVDDFRKRYTDEKFRQIRPASYGETAQLNNGEPFVEDGIIRNDKVYYIDTNYNKSINSPANTLSKVTVTALEDGKYTITSKNWKQARTVSRAEIVTKNQVADDIRKPEADRLYASRNNKTLLYQMGDGDVQNVRGLVKTLEKVFKIKVEVLNEQEWEERGFDEQANGTFDRQDKTVYINEDRANKGTVVHEFGHVATEIIRQQFPELFAKVGDLVKGTKYEALVREKYPELTNEEDIVHEAVSWAIQEKGALLMEGDMSLYERFMDYLKRIYKRIAEGLNLPTPLVNFESLTLDAFSKEVANKILSGQEFDNIFNIQLSNDFESFSGTFAQKLDGENYVRGTTEASRVIYKPQEVNNIRKDLDDLAGKSPLYIQDFITNQIGAIYNEPYYRSKLGVRMVERFTPANINELANQLSRGALPTSSEFNRLLKDAWDYDAKIRAASTEPKPEEAKALVQKEFNEFKEEELAEQKTIVKLQADLDNALDIYNQYAKAVHSSVVENGQKSAAYVSGKTQADVVVDNMEKAVGGNKTKLQKGLMRTITNDFFDKFYNFASVSNLLGADNGLLRGIYDLQIFQNGIAARWQKYAQTDKQALEEGMAAVNGLKDGKDDIMLRKYDFTFLDNASDTPTLETKQFTLDTLLKIYQQYYTQINYGRHKKGVVDFQKHSDLYFDGVDYPAVVFKSEGKPLRRGYEITQDDRVFNILLDDVQLMQLKALFDAGGQHHDIFELFRQFYNKVGRFKAINDTYVTLNSEDLEELRGSVLTNLTPEELAQANDGYYFPTQSNTIKTIKSRDFGSNVEDIRYIKQRSNLYGALRGSDGSALADVDRYISESVKYIRNSEVRQSLSVFLSQIYPNVNKNQKAVIKKLKWLEQYIEDLDSYDSRAREAALSKDFLGIPFTNYNQLMSNFATAVFAFNLGNPLKQATGQFAALGTGVIKDKYHIAAQKYFIPALLNSYKGLIAPEGKVLGQIEGGKYFGFKNADAWTQEIFENDYASDLYMRIFDNASNTGGVDIYEYQRALQQGNYSERTRVTLDIIGKVRGQVDKYGLAAMHKSDRAVIVSFYVAAKAQVQDEVDGGLLRDEANNLVTDINSDTAKKRIAALSTQTAYMTNNMYMINDKTGMQRDLNVWSRAIGLFSSQPQKIANLFMQTLFNAARADFSDVTLNKQLKSSINYAIVMGAIMNASVTMFYGMLKHGYDDDEDYTKSLAFETARNMIGIFPSMPTEVINGVFSAIDDKAWTNGVAENAVFENMNKMITALNAYHESLDEEATDYYRNKSFNTAVYGGVDGLSKLLGFPNVFAGKISEQFKVDLKTGQ